MDEWTGNTPARLSFITRLPAGARGNQGGRHALRPLPRAGREPWCGRTCRSRSKTTPVRAFPGSRRTLAQTGKGKNPGPPGGRAVLRAGGTSASIAGCTEVWGGGVRGRRSQEGSVGSDIVLGTTRPLYSVGKVRDLRRAAVALFIEVVDITLDPASSHHDQAKSLETLAAAPAGPDRGDGVREIGTAGPGGGAANIRDTTSASKWRDRV